MNRDSLIGFSTILKKEVIRFMRIWSQTLLPSAVTMTLYFIIFGHILGGRVGLIDGVNYMQYIMPGLVMMAVITNAYSNVSSSFFSLKFQRSIDELIISPLPPYMILLGFVLGGVFRGLVVGAIVTAISLFFTDIHIAHYGLMFVVVLLSATLFSLAGFLNALFAKKFDDIAIIPTFVLTPLTYLGGIFYSIELLPPLWHKLSLLNPIVYMVGSFRYSLLGVSDVNVFIACLFIIVCVVVLFMVNLKLLTTGFGIKS